jgi:hypothetical protein
MVYYSDKVGVPLHELIDLCALLHLETVTTSYQDAYKRLSSTRRVCQMKDVSTDYFEDDSDDFNEE